MMTSLFSTQTRFLFVLAGKWGKAELWVLPAIGVVFGAIICVYVVLGRRKLKLRIAMLERDFLRRDQLNEQLHRTEKIKTQGVFHDFNNLLHVMIGYSEMVKGSLSENSPTYGFMEKALDSAQKARELLKQLNGLGYRNVTHLKRLDLDEVLTNQIPLLRHVIGENHDIRFSPDIGEKFIYGGEEQLKIVLQDLLENARDSMPDGGEIIVSTQRAQLPEADEKKEARNYIQVTVKDAGCGIPEKYVQKIFEPFFSYGKGPEAVGLGLYTVTSIVEGHGGAIDVQTKEGDGTSVVIYFPEISELNPSDNGAPHSPSPAESPGGNETILIADDDPAIREIAVNTLKAAGYRVMVAKDGDEAIHAIQEHGDDIHLVILDIIMPGQSGYSVYDYLKQLKPARPVLFSSGCSYEELLETYNIDIPRSNMVDKPYRANELMREVRRHLDHEDGQ